MTHRKKHKLKLRSFYVWHRMAGLTAALFVAILSVTGLMLNHTETLDLDKQYVTSSALLNWYGIHAPTKVTNFTVGKHQISLLGEQLFFDGHLLSENTKHLYGAIRFNGMLVIAHDARLLLLTDKGEVIERLGGAQGVPAGLSSIGLTQQGQLVARAAHGDYLADDDLFEWRETGTMGVTWAKPAALPSVQYNALRVAYQGHGLPLERVILDFHSGRILGKWGVYLMDVAAILFLFLAFSGVWVWFIRKWRERERNQPHPEQKYK